MHVALYAPAWPANQSPSGIVTYVHHLRRELIRQGHRVSIFCRRIGPGNQDSNVHLVKPGLVDRALDRLRKLGGRGGEYMSWGRYIASKIDDVHRRDPIDVIEMEEFWGWCATVQERLPVPVVVKLHGPGFLTSLGEEREDRKTRIRIELEGRALRKISGILAPSRTTLSSTLSRYGLNPPVQKVIPNPLALESDERWDVETCDRKTILFVGRFDRLKGGDIALIAFRKLLEIDSELQLVFVGPDVGVKGKDGSRMSFDEFAASLFTPPQRSRIRYLGKLPRAEIFKLRTTAMVTVVASRWENQPNTALEAMIQGCPVVSLNTGGMSEIIEHEQTGLLTRPEDIDDLCRGILRPITDPSLARRLGGNARRRITERHSVERLTVDTVEAYRETLALRSSLA